MIDELGPIPDHANGRRVWGIIAARIEQHHHAYDEVVDHEGAYESHREIVDDILDEMQTGRTVTQRSQGSGIEVEL